MKDFRWKTMGRLGNNLFQFAYLYSQVRDGKIPNIYLQSEKYFQKYASEIKGVLGKGIGREEKIAIHVRRGDYVNNPFYVDLFSAGYYERAMLVLPTNESEDDKLNYLIFSDDIEWCKQQELFSRCSFSEGLSEEDDMNRMASCTGHIISNSSFSWWGAYLSPHGGQVVAPKEWYADDVQRTDLLAHWKKI